MGFLSVCTALYDYQAQADGELEIKEGELLYILEKDSGDDWWKAKKRAVAEEDDEPVGLIPNNYVEQVSVEGPLFTLLEFQHLRQFSFQARISQWT
jgi:hypothetical protein